MKNRIYYKNYLIDDFTDGNYPDYPAVPETKVNKDIKKIIKGIPEMKTISDFLYVFNTTGLIIEIEKWYSYYNESDERVEFGVIYSMFGTRLSGVNTDEVPYDTAESGIFTKGQVSTWEEEFHLHALKNVWNGYFDYYNDISSFYDLGPISIEKEEGNSDTHDSGTVIDKRFLKHGVEF